MIINEYLVYAGATYGKYATNSSTGAQTAVSITDTECVLFTGAGTRIQGIAGGASALSGAARDIVIIGKNASSIPLLLQHENASATAANRIDTGTGYDLVIPSGGGAQLRYDAVSSRWRVISATPISADSFYCLAGENLAANDLLYISDGTDGRTTGRAYKCDPTNAVRCQAVGFTRLAVTSGNDCYPVSNGVLTTSGLSTGLNYYASVTTPGLLQSTAPSGATQYIVSVGQALSATQLWINLLGRAETPPLSYPISARNIVGDTSGTAVPAGNLGEQIRSVVSTPTSYPATAVWGDLTSISLTAGVWDINVNTWCFKNTATPPAGGAYRIGVSTTAGNSTAGLVIGDNYNLLTASTTGLSEGQLSIPQYRVVVSSTTTYYLKYMTEYTSGTPQTQGRISAVRVG